MEKYIRLCSVALLVTLLTAIAFNFWVDPYGLYQTNVGAEWKPHAATQGALIKPYQALRAEPVTLILGNSRAEMGFDPDDPAWPQQLRPVYNLALPGSGTLTAKRLFNHVLAATEPRMIVLGVDFMDFLVASDAREGDPGKSDRLLVTADGQPNKWRWVSMLHDGVSTLASLDSVLHSLDTLRVQGKTGVEHLTPAGFNPGHNYLAMARQEGYFNLFRQRDTENIHSYQRRHRNLFTGNSRTSPEFENVANILSMAHRRQIRVIVLIYPYHAHLLEILRMTNFSELFEDWKRKLADLVASEGRGDATLWDFSGYHEFAREQVPERGDRSTEVHWYWEAGHFKSVLGHEMLQRVLGSSTADFGVILTPENVEKHLQTQRIAGESYRSNNVNSVQQLEQLTH